MTEDEVCALRAGPMGADPQPLAYGDLALGRVGAKASGQAGRFVDLGGAQAGFLPDRRAAHLTPDQLREGASILVQIDRDAVRDKGPQLTAAPLLPGLFAAYAPFGNGVNWGITRGKSAKKSANFAKSAENLAPLSPPQGGSVIRRRGAGASTEQLAKELQSLAKTWSEIAQWAKSEQPPARWPGRSLVERYILDLAPVDDLDAFEVLIDDPERAREAKAAFAQVAPAFAEQIKAYTDKAPLLRAFDAEVSFTELVGREIDASDGVSLVIEESEALTAIDVNAAAVSHARKTNTLAAREAARQIRRRDIGGQVMIDFLFMRDAEDRKAVQRVLSEAVQADEAQVELVGFTRLGLFELTRKRRGRSWLDEATEIAPADPIPGRRWTADRLAKDALYALDGALSTETSGRFVLEVAPSIHDVIEANPLWMDRLSNRRGGRFSIEQNKDFLRDHYDIKRHG